MKTSFLIFFPFILFFLSSVQINAQSKVSTDTIKVEGVCNMCQNRIQKAAFVKGVKWAEWDKSTQELVVIYRNKKTDLNRIATAVAEAGHDNSIKKAPKEKYNELPDCCAYRDGVHVH